ncbi:MAG: amidohydrolase family protein [Patescibacteria group bacterium]
MNKQKVVSIISKIAEIKKNTGIKITDTHIHPLDVMGVVHYADIKNEYVKNDYFDPGILEKLNYSNISKIGSRLFLKLFPEEVNNIIKETYIKITEKRILDEMDNALIDDSVMLPIEPWLSTKISRNNFLSNRLSVLGSIDIHKIKLEDVDSFLKNLIIKYRIKGIKFHPNLQNFKPQPNHNPPELAEKLHKIYKFAEREHLYLLFHGGISFYTDFTDSKYQRNIFRSRTNAVLKNFCDNNGKSELFENYNVPIVIAHLGHYGIMYPDYKLIKTIAKKFGNVYFDTAGVPPSFIKNTLDLISSQKIIFGSDALYNKMAYNLAFLYSAIENTSNGERKENIFSNIFQKNILNITSI